MYSKFATINVWTADGYVFISEETFPFSRFICYLPFTDQINIRFPPAECIDKLFDPWVQVSVMNRVGVLRRPVLSNLSLAFLYWQSKTFDFIFKVKECAILVNTILEGLYLKIFAIQDLSICPERNAFYSQSSDCGSAFLHKLKICFLKKISIFCL